MDDAEGSSRELTLEEAVQFAILLQKGEQLSHAQELYRRVLAAEPDHPQALHFSGVLAHQLHQDDEAVGLIERSVALEPGLADWHSNLGIVYQSVGRLEEAAAEYRRAIALDPGHANAYSNLGVVLRATGQAEAAETAYRTAIDLNPGHVDAYTNLGVLLNALNRPKEAAACYCKAITLRPRHREARRLLAIAHCTLGEVGAAVAILEEWLEEEPADPVARHMLAACTGRDVPTRASDEFVERTFDAFAASFESKLQRLSYRAPALVEAMLGDSGLEPAASLEVLDAGCGTGLCGPLVARYARRLTGVDLSAGMLAQAREKGVYDALVRSELTDYLRANRAAFDLIVSADTLVYFGVLEAAIGAAAKALRPNGVFVFTLERAAEEAGADYRLELHGRYSHARQYVERLLVQFGLEPAIGFAELRMEAGAPVAGLVVRARKPHVARQP
jgi:predicted TPR repeat methyltransferase